MLLPILAALLASSAATSQAAPPEAPPAASASSAAVSLDGQDAPVIRAAGDASGDPRREPTEGELAQIRAAARAGLRPARTLVRPAAAVLGLTAVFALLLGLLGRLFPRLREKVLAARTERLPTLRVQHLTLLTAEQSRKGLLSALTGLRSAAFVAMAYLYLTAVFSQFPATRGLTRAAVGYALAPLLALVSGFARFLPNLIFIGVTLIIVRTLLRAASLVFAEIGKGALRFPGFYAEWAEPTWQIARVLILAFTVVVIFPYLPGSDSPAFKGVTVFLGVLLSIGSGSTVANSISGVIMTYMRPFRMGDRVRIADTEGDVVECSLLVTRVRTPKNAEVTIPNSVVLGSHIVNYSAGSRAPEGLLLHTSVTIGYDVPWRRVHELLIGAAKATEGIRASPEPFVLQSSLGDFSVAYELNASTDRPNEMPALYSRLHANIQDQFNAAGIEIMSPRFVVRRTRPDSTIPPGYGPRSAS